MLCVAAAFTIGACDTSPDLPNGYQIRHGDRSKAWLQSPDGTFAYAGLIKDVYVDERQVLLIAFPVSYGGKTVPPYPLDSTCYVALMIDTSTGQKRQISLTEASRLAAHMSN